MLTAIVGILLGNFLIGTLFAPALLELRRVLTSFSEIELPFESILGERVPPDERRVAQKTATRQFNRSYREYMIAFNAFKKLGLVFVVAIVLLACVVVWEARLSVPTRVCVMALLCAAIVGAAFYLQRGIAPTPDQLASIDFLQNNFANLHLSALFDCAEVRVDFGRELHEEVAHFRISQKLLFLGYRFLMVVSNESNSRLYFVAHGQVDGGAKVRHLWTPELQMFYIPVGDFSLSEAIRAEPLLCLHLWLFVPTPKGWGGERVLHPRVLNERITANLGGQTGLRLSLDPCSWDSLDVAVDFVHKRLAGLATWRITRLLVATPNSPQVVLRMFRSTVEDRRGKVTSCDYPHGMNVE